MTDKFVKGYALIKSKTISPSILDTYLPFIATIIVDEGMDVVDEIANTETNYMDRPLVPQQIKTIEIM